MSDSFNLIDWLNSATQEDADAWAAEMREAGMLKEIATSFGTIRYIEHPLYARPTRGIKVQPASPSHDPSPAPSPEQP